MQYTYILIRFNYMQNKLYNCSEIGQRIIQFKPANDRKRHVSNVPVIVPRTFDVFLDVYLIRPKTKSCTKTEAFILLGSQPNEVHNL